MTIQIPRPASMLAAVQQLISDALPGTIAQRYTRTSPQTSDTFDKNTEATSKNKRAPGLAQGLQAPTKQSSARPAPQAEPGILLPGQSVRNVRVSLRDLAPDDVFWGSVVQDSDMWAQIRGCKTLEIAGCNILVDADARLVRGAGADGVDHLILGGRDGKPELVLPLRFVTDPRWGDDQGHKAVVLALWTPGKKLLGSLPPDEVTETVNWRLPVSALFQIGYATPKERGGALAQLKDSASDDGPYIPPDLDRTQYYLTNWHPAGADYVLLPATQPTLPQPSQH